jgi:uncharacterized membrane protein YadS
MLKIILLFIPILLILIILRNSSKKNNLNKSNKFNKLILIFLVVGFLFIIATSGKFIIPQLLQIIKVALPLLTKFIGI